MKSPKKRSQPKEAVMKAELRVVPFVVLLVVMSSCSAMKPLRGIGKVADIHARFERSVNEFASGIGSYEYSYRKVNPDGSVVNPGLGRGESADFHVTYWFAGPDYHVTSNYVSSGMKPEFIEVCKDSVVTRVQFQYASIAEMMKHTPYVFESTAADRHSERSFYRAFRDSSRKDVVFGYTQVGDNIVLQTATVYDLKEARASFIYPDRATPFFLFTHLAKDAFHKWEQGIYSCEASKVTLDGRECYLLTFLGTGRTPIVAGAGSRSYTPQAGPEEGVSVWLDRKTCKPLRYEQRWKDFATDVVTISYQKTGKGSMFPRTIHHETYLPQRGRQSVITLEYSQPRYLNGSLPSASFEMAFPPRVAISDTRTKTTYITE